MNERHATLAHRASATHAGHSPPRVRHRRDAALFPNYFGRLIIRPRRCRSAVKLSRGRSVGLSVRACVRTCVALPSALWKKGGSDPDAFEAHHYNEWDLRRTCATLPRRGPLPKLLWANLFMFIHRDRQQSNKKTTNIITSKLS